MSEYALADFDKLITREVRREQAAFLGINAEGNMYYFALYHQQDDFSVEMMSNLT